MSPRIIHEKCSGCGTCRLACSLTNFAAVQPSKALLWIEGRFPAPGDYRIHVCDECGICAENCPAEAITRDSGVYRVDPERCTECLLCVSVCPHGVMMKPIDGDVPVKCNHCGACAEACPRGAIAMPQQTPQPISANASDGENAAVPAPMDARPTNGTEAPRSLGGYAGTLLRVNLSTGSIKKEPLDDALKERFIGGRGFVAKLLFDELPRGIDPFDAKNLFIAATGPLSGHFMPASGKTHFGTKSPANGGYADSNMGGHFGPALKYAGYDVLVVTGQAPVPSYLHIEDDRVEIRPADAYWGEGALTAEKHMKTDLDEDFQILTIGPAGEKRVRYACLSHDFGRQAGRCGVGAVLGSKRLKAIAVKGTGRLPVSDVRAAFDAGRDAFRKVFSKPGFRDWTPEGTAGITNWTNEMGVFPTRNFQTSFSDHYQTINGKAVMERLKITDKGCYCCPTPCGKYGHTKTSLGSAHVEGPEYETIALFGGNCALATIEEVAYANYLCDELGLDTISAGAVVSWAIECVEKGIFTPEEIGRPVRFADLATVQFLLEKIAARDGIGDLLAEGVKRAAEKTGQGSEVFAIHVKGLEWTGYECRNAPSMMLAYMTADIGAHHARAWVLGHDMAGAWTSVHDLVSGGGTVERQPPAQIRAACADYVIDSQHTRPLFDVLGVCRLQYMELGFELEHYETLFHAITGRKCRWDELLKVSERIWNLTRAISMREIQGFGRGWDYPPERFSAEPVPTGPNQGYCLSKEKLDRLLDWYYAARGWDDNGRPTRETLIGLDLEDVADALTAEGISLS